MEALDTPAFTEAKVFNQFISTESWKEIHKILLHEVQFWYNFYMQIPAINK